MVCSSPKSSLRDSILLFRTQVYKTRDLCGIFLAKSSSIKRVFETRVLYTTRVSKTRYASLLKPFKRVLTYYLSPLTMLVCKIPHFFNGGFTFSVFILWFWLFCALILVGVIWFVIWWAFGSLLWFDFGWVSTVVHGWRWWAWKAPAMEV